MGVVTGAISIRDNMSAVLRSVRQEQTAFRRDVSQTRRELQATWDRRRTARLDATAANRTAQNLRQRLEPLRRRIVTAVAIRDMATARVRAVANKVKAVGKMIVSPLIKLKDGISAGISKIGGKLKNLAKTVAIPVTIAATIATAALGGAVSSGMQLENQQVSMKHFIGATNKGMDESAVQKVADEFTKQLRDNANATPFETGEVIAAGSRAVSIASGDTKSAMALVKLSEDMAAASGGTKSISDAMEALADAKMGEMERLKEFGFKVSAEAFDSKGFDGVAADLQDFYGGAAEKLAQTGSGLMSTIKGKLKSNVADFGLNVVEKLKPMMGSIISLIDQVSPVIEKFGIGLADKIGQGITAAAAFMPKLISGFASVEPVISGFISGFAPLLPQLAQFGGTVMNTIQQVMTSVMPAIGSIINTVQSVLPSVLPVLETVVTTIGSIIGQAAPVIAGLVEGIGMVVKTLAPVFSKIFGEIGEKVGSVIGFVGERMGFIKEIIATAAPLISSVLSTAWDVISPVLDIAISVFKVMFNVTSTVFHGILKVVSGVWEKLKPIVDGVASGLSWISEKVSGLFDGGGATGSVEVGQNANGTNNWRGGPTWVGERGPELVELPRGSRVLPNKESVSIARGAAAPAPPVALAAASGTSVPPPASKITITIAKLADSIIVREEADIDKIGEAIARKVSMAVANLAPA